MTKTTFEQQMTSAYKGLQDALNTSPEKALEAHQVYALGEAFIATRNNLESRGESAKANQVDGSLSELTSVCEVIEATKGGKIPAGELRKKLLESEELKPVLAIIQEENKALGPLIDPKTRDADRLAARRSTVDASATITEGGGLPRTKSEPALTPASLVETMRRTQSAPSLTTPPPKAAGHAKGQEQGRG